jgi:hypothetical protein
MRGLQKADLIVMVQRPDRVPEIFATEPASLAVQLPSMASETSSRS